MRTWHEQGILVRYDVRGVIPLKLNSDASGVKICRVCGRKFSWQKRWEDDWESVRVCSKACRKKGISKFDLFIEQTIIDCLTECVSQKVKPPHTITPEDVAAKIWPSNWRSNLSKVHDACRRLGYENRIEIYQGTKKIEPSTLKGKVQLRLSKEKI